MQNPGSASSLFGIDYSELAKLKTHQLFRVKRQEKKTRKRKESKTKQKKARHK